MKRIRKITRIQLKTHQVDKFSLLGIVSAEPDYRLSLSINKKFRISLKNISPIKITGKTGYDLSFSRFSDISESKEILFTLYSNRSGKNFLIKKLKNVDYIFQIRDTENENNIGLITSGLKEIESVNAVFNIDLNFFKDKHLQYLSQ